MSGIAEICLSLGFVVSGSDLQESDATRRLQELGATIQIGHRREHGDSADVVIVSSAVSHDNPEIQGARERSVPVIPRTEMLVDIIRMVGKSIVVAGAHGKTTTTSLIGAVFSSAGLDPTVIVGGKVNSMGSGARLGRGGTVVAESDESDGSFLLFNPSVAVVTNIDHEHLGHYGSMENLERAFGQFISRVSEDGLVVVWKEDSRLSRIIGGLSLGSRRVRTFGFSDTADWSAREIVPGEGGIAFDVYRNKQRLGRIRMGIPGRHNVLNILAVMAVGEEFNVDFQRSRSALEEFTGVQRRFQIYGEWNGVLVVDDYGHHPTEVQATIRAARESFSRRLVVLFQPHRYSRTRDLFREFTTAFTEVDVLLVTEIYPASETPIPGISGELLANGIREAGHSNVVFVPSIETAIFRIKEIVRPGDLLLTLGAGNVYQVAKHIVEGDEGG